MTTPAHNQRVTHSYVVRYPAHDPRTTDVHYKDFEAFRRRTHKTAKCAVGEKRNDYSECAGVLELHHHSIEFALQNSVDLVWLEADYPGVSDPDSVGAWVESAENLVWLCLVPDTPVRMADGSERAIADVCVGDYVMTHDGTAQPVLDTFRKPYSGEVFGIGSAYLTPTHRVLTHRGWIPAAEIERQIRMHGPHVILVRCEEEQVFRGVVSPVTVDVMNALGVEEGATDHLLHDPAMLEDLPFDAVIPDVQPYVTLRRELALSFRDTHSLLTVKANQSTRVGTVVDSSYIVPPLDDRKPTLGTYDLDPSIDISRLAFSDQHARSAASGVTPSDAVRRQKSRRTDFATPFGQRSAPLYGGWYALREVRRVSYTGYVHDITIANSHSFIAGGAVVHNCTRHHRGDLGVHVLTSADWQAMHYIKGLIE